MKPHRSDRFSGLLVYLFLRSRCTLSHSKACCNFSGSVTISIRTGYVSHLLWIFIIFLVLFSFLAIILFGPINQELSFGLMEFIELTLRTGLQMEPFYCSFWTEASIKEINSFSWLLLLPICVIGKWSVSVSLCSSVLYVWARVRLCLTGDFTRHAYVFTYTTHTMHTQHSGTHSYTVNAHTLSQHWKLVYYRFPTPFKLSIFETSISDLLLPWQQMYLLSLFARK